MSNCVKNILFFLMCLTLPFNCIPKQIQMNFLGGPLAGQLMFYPVFLGICYTVYCQIKYRNVLISFDKFKRYLLLYIIVTFMSLIYGLYIYPYYDLILAGPVEQVEKIPKLLAIVNEYGINITAKELLSFWMFARPIKGMFFEIAYTLGVSYMIFCWYYNDWQCALDILVKGILCSLLICLLYSSIEVFYLAGNESAKRILEIITPYIHSIKTSVNWWPPLLWKGQLRTVFPEPSHVGNYAAIVLPLLWCKILDSENKKQYILLTFLFNCMIFLTKARTANAMFFGMLLLLVLLILGNFKKYWKNFVVILMSSALAFGASLYFINNFMELKKYDTAKKTTTIQAEQFIENNVTSLASNTKRSNGARYALLRSNMRIGMDNLFLGVGKGLASAYIVDNFTLEERNNPEVKMWISYIKEKGIMRYQLGAMNEYVGRFAQTGITGLIVFLLPFLFVIKKLLCKYIFDKSNNKMEVMFLLLSLVSSMVAAMNGSITLLYSVWLLIPISYAYVLNERIDEKDMGEKL